MAGITIRSLIEESATLQVRCTGCGRADLYRGEHQLRRCAATSRRMRELQGRLRCRECGSRAELLITFGCTMIDDDRRTPNPVSPLTKPGPPLWG